MGRHLHRLGLVLGSVAHEDPQQQQQQQQQQRPSALDKRGKLRGRGERAMQCSSPPGNPDGDGAGGGLWVQA